MVSPIATPIKITATITGAMIIARFVLLARLIQRPSIGSKLPAQLLTHLVYSLFNNSHDSTHWLFSMLA